MRFRTADFRNLIDVDFSDEPTDQIRIYHNVFAYVLNESGQVLRMSRGRNKVTNVGISVLRDMLGGTGYRATHIAVGSGTQPAAAGDAALQTELFRQKIDRRIPEPAKMTFQILLGTGDQNGLTFREVGLFEGTSVLGGNKLLARSILSPAIDKTNLIQVTIAHEIGLVAL